MNWARFRYACTMTWRYRRALKQLAQDASRRCQVVTQIDVDWLQTYQVRGLVLDFDGVLAPHGALEPLPDVVTWLRTLMKAMPELSVFILSNKPKPIRAAWFTVHFPSIEFIAGVRKKPFPDGLQRIAERTGIAPAALVLVDDRILTGMLATCIARTQGLWVTQAYKDMRRNPVRESFFFMLRTLEKILF